MSQPQREQLRAAFAVFDADQRGKLSVDELVGVLIRPGGGAPVDEKEGHVLRNLPRDSCSEMSLRSIPITMVRITKGWFQTTISAIVASNVSPTMTPAAWDCVPGFFHSANELSHSLVKIKPCFRH